MKKRKYKKCYLKGFYYIIRFIKYSPTYVTERVSLLPPFRDPQLFGFWFLGFVDASSSLKETLNTLESSYICSLCVTKAMYEFRQR